MKIKQVMNKALVVEDNLNLKQAAKIMSHKNIGSLIVMKKDKIVGIITERDIIKNVNKLDSKLSNVMSKSLITIDDGESLDKAALLMAEHKIKKLPVLKNKRLVGIVTATDVLANVEDLNEQFLFN